MTFVPYVRLVAGGVLRSSQSWSMGMSFLTSTAHTQTELSTWITSIDSNFVTFFGITAIKVNNWDTTTVYQGLKAYQYATDNHAVAQAQFTSGGVTGTGTAGAPSQCALVLSIKSGLGSRNHRGRLYLPVTGRGGWNTSGQAGSTDVSAIATAFKVLVNALNLTTIGGAATTFGIASKAGGFTVVGQSVFIDSKIDTQRRRTDKVAALTSSSATF